MKILAVDDDATALEILDLALATAGYDRVDLAQSAAEAIDFLEDADTPYDCLLLDIIMPGMDGVELCRHVRRMPGYAHVPIIMITASQHKDTLISAIASGATDYVHKPFDGLELVARLRAAALLMAAARTPARAAARRPADAPPVNAPSALHLGDSLCLTRTPGLVTPSELVCDILQGDHLPRSTQLFAVAISDATHLFTTLEPAAFRAFVNDLAKTIAHVAQSWAPHITYVGNAVFLVALKDAGSLSAKGVQSVFKASLATMTFDAVVAYPRDIVLHFEHVRVTGPEDYVSVNALNALFKVGDLARDRASHRLTAEREKDLRLNVLGRNAQDAVTACDIPLMRAAPQKIMPRRVSRQQMGTVGAAEQGETHSAPMTRNNA